jgi:hypothetical protein
VEQKDSKANLAAEKNVEIHISCLSHYLWFQIKLLQKVGEDLLLTMANYKHVW